MTRLALACPLASLLALALPAAAPAQPPGTTVFAPTFVSGYWGYTYDPYAQRLHGAADLTRSRLHGLADVTRSQGEAYKNILDSEGEYYNKIQEAIAKREKNRQERLVTRKKALEQWAWEKEFRAEVFRKERERAKKEEVEHARDHLPLAELLSGSILNTLLDDLKKYNYDSPAGSVEIPPDCLTHINVTTHGDGHTGLLKARRLAWPILLQHEQFKEDREGIEDLLKQAREHARQEKAVGEVLFKLRDRVAGLEGQVTQLVREKRHLPRHHIEADRFLKELTATLNMLEDAKEAKYLLGASLKGKTVHELVKHMSDEGLRFGPALRASGAQRHYRVLHDALATESARLARRGSSGSER
jgi:hypothetical protein